MSNGSKATIPLGQIAEIDMGTSPPGTSYNKEGIGVPLINGPTEFTDNSPVPQQWTTEPTRVCRKGDILICVRGASTGRMNTADREYCIGRGVAALRDRGDPLATPFLRYVIEHQLPSLLRSATGSTFVAVDKKAIANIPVPAFDARQRREAARLLHRWEGMELLFSRIVAAKREFKRGLMQELLTGRRRFPEFGPTTGWRYTLIGELPQDWEVLPLSAVAQEVTRRNGEGIDLVLTCSGEHGLIDQREFFSKLVASESREGYFLLRKGEFAYNRSSMKGYPFGAIKRLDRYDAGALSTLNICFAVNETIWDPDFAVHFFESGLLNRQLGRITRVGSRAHGLLNVNKSDFFSLRVPVPSHEEQRRIASVLNTFDREINRLMTLKSAYQEKKRGLMQKLLTGELAVPVSSQLEPVHA